MKTCIVLSFWSTTSLEEVAEASGSGLKWCQLYIFRDRQLTKELVLRAERAGYKALVITLDQPITGRRLVDERNDLELPRHLSMPNYSGIDVSAQSSRKVNKREHLSAMFDTSLDWSAIDWLRGITKLPIILKGILTAEDTEEAVKHNVQGILVSNHGARQLDGVPATVSDQKWERITTTGTPATLVVCTHTHSI